MWLLDGPSSYYIYYNDLRLDFKIELILHIMKSIKETFLMIVKLELSLKASLNKKSLSTPESSILRLRDMATMLTSDPDQVF